MNRNSGRFQNLMLDSPLLNELYGLVSHGLGEVTGEDLIVIEQSLPQQGGVNDIERGRQRVQAIL